MNPRLPRVGSAEVLRALHRAGWYDVRQSGSHLALQHPTKLGTVTVPRHRGTLRLDTLLSILKQAEMTREELLDLL